MVGRIRFLILFYSILEKCENGWTYTKLSINLTKDYTSAVTVQRANAYTIKSVASFHCFTPGMGFLEDYVWEVSENVVRIISLEWQLLQVNILFARNIIVHGISLKLDLQLDLDLDLDLELKLDLELELGLDLHLHLHLHLDLVLNGNGIGMKI